MKINFLSEGPNGDNDAGGSYSFLSRVGKGVIKLLAMDKEFEYTQIILTLREEACWKMIRWIKRFRRIKIGGF